MAQRTRKEGKMTGDLRQEMKRKKMLKKTSGITPEFAKSVEEFINEYRPVLNELAKR